MLLDAYAVLRRERRAVAALHEAPVAQVMSLLANRYRDPAKTPTAFTPADFTLYRDREDEAPPLPREAVAVLLALQNEGLAVPLLHAVWPQVLAAADTASAVPPVRALVNADRTLWLIAPTWERGGIRSALVACSDVRGPVALHDVDRPLTRYAVTVPLRPHATWFEARLLLNAGVAQPTSGVAAQET